jgi:hypothetical protein
MKQLLALMAIGLLGICATACGSSSKGVSSISQASSTGAQTTTTVAAPPGGYLKSDGDKDKDEGSHDVEDAANDDSSVLSTYGKKAGGAVKQAVALAVRNYYAAATAGNGAKACSLLAAGLAANLAEGQGQSARPKTCTATVLPLFAQEHQRLLADDAATMVVPAVYVKGNVGLALLGFRAVPEGQILLLREGHAWKIDAVVDSEVP